jgi:hypothetical protein
MLRHRIAPTTAGGANVLGRRCRRRRLEARVREVDADTNGVAARSNDRSAIVMMMDDGWLVCDERKRTNNKQPTTATGKTEAKHR